MSLNDIEIFVKIADLASFSRAAEVLGVPKSTVSRRISLMEESLGVKLINRTTRHLSLSSIGQAYYEKCQRVLEQVDEANSIIRGLKTKPAGRLRLSVPYELGLFFLPNIISDFLKTYTSVSLELELTNRMVDLVEEGVDLALRIGQLADSSLTALKLGTMRGGIYASPEYFKDRPLPEHPHELPLEECIRFRTTQVNRWLFRDAQGTLIEILPQGRLIANSMKYISESALNGLGIAAINKAIASPHVQAGRLVELLANYKLELADLYAVYPSRKFLPANVRTFIEFIKPRLAAVFDYS